MLTSHGNTFSIAARGKTWSGLWKVDGREVCVDSAYGSRRAPIGRRRPEAVAQDTLADIVDGWAATRP